MTATTRLFRYGNSQAVHIPADLAYEHFDLDLEIERYGDELGIRPARRLITGVLVALSPFSINCLAGGRPDQEQAEGNSYEPATLQPARYQHLHRPDEAAAA